MDDWDLLQQYVGNGSKEALDELVRRHLPMVYAAALRQVREPHLAEDVTQAVFLVLMKRANRISSGVVLGGWLFNVTRFAAARAKRDMWRRQKHEEKAAAMKPTMGEVELAGSSEEISRLLDDALAGLSRADRDAVILKFLQGKSNAEVAQAQGINENAARQRVFRALGKLRIKLNRKGASVTDDLLGASLAMMSSHPPPAQLADRVIHVLHDSTLAGASTALAESVLRIILMAKIKTLALAGAALVVLLGLGGLIIRSAVAGDAAGAPAPQGAKVADTPNHAFLDVLSAFGRGDGEGMVADFAHLTPEQEKTIRQIAAGMAVGNEIRDAVADKFGKSAGQNILRMLGFTPPINVPGVEKIPATIDGDNAQLNIPHLGVIYFERIDGRWKLSSDVLFDNKNAVERFAMFTANSAEFQKLIAEVKADKYQGIPEVETAFKQLMTRLQDIDPAGELPDRPAVLGPGTRPTETFAAIYWANLTGDKAAAVSCLMNPTVEQQTQLGTSVQLFSAGEQLRLAIVDQFGKRVARNTILTLGLDPGMTKQMLVSLKDDSSGDKVDIDLSRIGLKVSMVKVNGVWQIDPSFMGPSNPQWRARLLDYFLPKVNQLTADVKAGTYQSPAQLQAAVDDLRQEMAVDRKRLAPATQPN